MPALTEDGQTSVDVSEALQHGGIGGVVAGIDKRVAQFGRHAWLDVCGPVGAPGISDYFQQSCPRPSDRVQTPQRDRKSRRTYFSSFSSIQLPTA